MMVPLFSVMVIKTLSTKLSFSYQPHLLEEFQSPINGGFINSGIFNLNPSIDLGSSDMLFGFMESIQDHDTLWRELVPFFL
jgi:hypothetical protein